MFGRNLRWFDPWREFKALEEEFERGIGSFWHGTRGYPAINYYTHGDDAVITAEIPGVDPADIDISVEGSTLTISGESKPVELKEGETCHRQERRQGKFSRTLELPFSVESEKVEAGFKNGILTITLPRAEAEKPRKIMISNN